jgi:hypothetical protein
MSSQATSKILRIGLIQNGRIVEERLLRSPQTVTVGHGIKRNTFVVPVSNLPRTQVLFEARDGKWILHFTPTMSGRLSLGDGIETLEELSAKGKAKKGAHGFEIPLGGEARGKVIIGEVTILF